MTSTTPHTFSLRRCNDSETGSYFDVCDAGSDHALATVMISPSRPDRLHVVHPAYFYRHNLEVTGAGDRTLLAWLSDLANVNAALADVGAPAVRYTSWIESVTRG